MWRPGPPAEGPLQTCAGSGQASQGPACPALCTGHLGEASVDPSPGQERLPWTADLPDGRSSSASLKRFEVSRIVYTLRQDRTCPVNAQESCAVLPKNTHVPVLVSRDLRKMQSANLILSLTANPCSRAAIASCPRALENRRRRAGGGSARRAPSDLGGPRSRTSSGSRPLQRPAAPGPLAESGVCTACGGPRSCFRGEGPDDGPRRALLGAGRHRRAFRLRSRGRATAR